MNPDVLRRLVQCTWKSLPSPRPGPPRVVLRRISEHRASFASIHPVTPPLDLPTTPIEPAEHRPAQNELELKPRKRPTLLKRALPTTCPGCGALSQESESTAPGFYTRSRKAIKAFVSKGSARIGPRALVEDGEDAGSTEHVPSSTPSNVPVCDRCHDLIHNSRGVSIAHPTIEDIAASIAESPYKRNHVYHVMDAADFPMSLIPNLHSDLNLAKPRSQNRRSQDHFTNRPTMSFLITRSDLLGTSREKVDSLMPYFRSVLRTALGRFGQNLRLSTLR